MKGKLLFATLLVMLAILAKAQPVTITPPEAHIDPGQSVTLRASGALYYQWSPATGLSTTEGAVTVASPTVTTTYTCEGYAPGDERVVNGDFAQGNTGFTSSYEYNSNLWAEGTYYVDADASLHHENFHGYGHDDNGNFMMVNGAISSNTNVWTEQITVLPNKWYAFSTWACTLAGGASQVARLQFSINGSQIGEVFSAPAQTMVWEQFYELWYSGASTSATITILNQNTGGDGNDFGLDDISFRELVLVGDPTCTVYVGSMAASATADDTELCEGESTTLHALPTGGSGNYSYSWTPAVSLNNATSQNPVATPPVGTTTYTCHITDNGWGSTQNVSVSIIVHPNEEENISHTICYGDVYNFYGEELSDPGVYEHQEETQFGCVKTIYLHLNSWPTYDETTVTANICPGESYTFYGTDYTESCDIAHTDQTVNGCDSIVRLHLTVYPPNDTTVVDASICVGQTFNFHGELYNQDGQIAYFDTIDHHGCLKVEKLMLSVGQYQMPPVVYQYECYEHGTEPSWTWNKTGITYHEDTEDEIILPDPEGGCDILHRLDLKFHVEYYHEETKIACDSYTWPVNGQTYTTSQNRVEAVFHNDFGDKICDSIYVLHLEISNFETNEFTVSDDESCDSYLWDSQGMAYTTDDEYNPQDHIYTQSGAYHRTYVNQQGCDSIVTMNVHFEYTPHPTEIYPMDSENTAPHWVVTATEFQINAYDFHLWDNNALCHWDTVMWSFENPEIRWVLEPSGVHGQECKVYVLNQVEDTVWLSARVFNHCAPNDGVEQRYWFVCSFYGLDGPMPVEAKVYPNPSQGTIIVEADDMERIRVVDMLGQVVADREYDHANHVTLDLNDIPSSIYLIEIKTVEGINKQRIVIGR